ncbi:TPA: hypothetical protein ACKQCJ_004644 [Stenotrophomonas maltophilia]|uniref:hypothetical protein n=1 Tax=Stenotrophomonas sp. CC22-02 TaxID=1378087 RepID=UPI00106391B7|nr:hypothetical protein [Stenotrophomonas sp. CC22-02]MBN5172079.1 hypothetical protein [Stenotrophomonas maltophilia]TDV29687.1 hypothetical protein N440_0484 [Stenotrophomonas sp. CC22-02]HEL3779033.1 hypothetical protein [Stenotrophomonas maltophilia]HEL3782046.1 hypothetical protein [Stenotrophomonas maltophilia]HEL5005299.1 hypothetical protein [Stenotrophomonas maltophilia]
MDAEHLEYFKAALEGRATVGWNVWFAANQQALAQQVSRPALLRLKFNHLHEAERNRCSASLSITTTPLVTRTHPMRNTILGPARIDLEA